MTGVRALQWRPPARLAAVVERFWSWEASAADAPPLLPVFPGTGLELVFHHRAPWGVSPPTNAPARALPPAHVLCVRGAPVPLAAAGDVGFVAVRVRAGMAGRLLRVPLGELADRLPSVAEVWGRAGQELAERVALAADDASRVALLAEFLDARLRRDGAPTPAEVAVRRLYYGPRRVRDVAGEVGLGMRRLEHDVRALTGVTPVRFRRLARMQRAVRRLVAGPPAARLSMAVGLDYHDQAQHIHELRELTGFTPGRLVRAAATRAHFYTPARGPEPDARAASGGSDVQPSPHPPSRVPR